MKLHPVDLEKGGTRHFVVLPAEEFDRLRQRLDDLEDLLALRQARNEDEGEPTQSVGEVADEVGLDLRERTTDAHG